MSDQADHSESLSTLKPRALIAQSDKTLLEDPTSSEMLFWVLGDCNLMEKEPFLHNLTQSLI